LIELIQKKLAAYGAVNQLDEEHATREILQEIALYGLWRTGFFNIAAFQGGTSLRILHGLARFSEDLDFIMKEPDSDFTWPVYLKGMLNCFQEFGLKAEVLDKSRMEQRIQKAMLKDNSICNQLNLSFCRGNSNRKQKIKLEIDINPPANSSFEFSYLDFPLDFEVCHQDLSSNLSLIIHALLCRPYVKGRDWYDFNWYTKQRIKPNIPHLQAALNQWGPWQKQKSIIDLKWLKLTLKNKVKSINWQEARNDVVRFLRPIEQHSLNLWNERFFLDKVEKLDFQE
jgi:predicted nucleotidyltransferase component of viral defense system